MLQTLINAIKDREVLKLSYSGISRGVQPHAVGVSLAGREVLLCYQIKGDHIGAGHQWNLMELAKITHVVATGEIFAQNAPDYKKGDERFSRIYMEV
ncbi:hypothetical protein A7981_04455 [Methylovorus sp. MM2]|uniref:hypothetical protein n=1 Tax=Methylovorus sp. MM2 TaxID=1848038 RepID=UPI0007DF8C9C|nr:hypothetical protein [Methylovorus sp. MM2]OAM52707.1 hypothetical protein A7981_04455 [Methylovorus sp. MM2]